jgi:hypothetical protein
VLGVWFGSHLCIGRVHEGLDVLLTVLADVCTGVQLELAVVEARATGGLGLRVEVENCREGVHIVWLRGALVRIPVGERLLEATVALAPARPSEAEQVEVSSMVPCVGARREAVHRHAKVHADETQEEVVDGRKVVGDVAT